MFAVAFSYAVNPEVIEVSYSTSYQSNDGEDYIVDGDQLTMECVCTGTLISVEWKILNGGSTQIYTRSPGSAAIISDNTMYESRIDKEKSVFSLDQRERKNLERF